MPSHVQVEATRAAAIKPFKAHIPDGVLDDLRRRLAKARWPDQLPGTTWEYGADIGAMRTLADYWQKKYDWRAQEARINRFAEFTTEIDGQRIHFIHQRSPRADAMPLLMLHGWPGSIVEFLALIEPLARPPVGDDREGAHSVDYPSRGAASVGPHARVGAAAREPAAPAGRRRVSPSARVRDHAS